MPSRPTGTITFLFIDIEGSTRLLQRLEGQYSDVLAAHFEILRDVLARHGGHEESTGSQERFAHDLVVSLATRGVSGPTIGDGLIELLASLWARAQTSVRRIGPAPVSSDSSGLVGERPALNPLGVGSAHSQRGGVPTTGRKRKAVFNPPACCS
jgi:class 3 adenylate cyclase